MISAICVLGFLVVILLIAVYRAENDITQLQIEYGRLQEYTADLYKKESDRDYRYEHNCTDMLTKSGPRKKRK